MSVYPVAPRKQVCAHCLFFSYMENAFGGMCFNHRSRIVHPHESNCTLWTIGDQK